MHLRILLILYLFSFLTKVFGQTDYELMNYVGPVNAKVYVTDNDSLSLDYFLSLSRRNLFKDVSNDIAKPSEIYWYYVDFSEIDLPGDTVQLYLRFPYYDEITLYYIRNDSVLTRKAGLRSEVSEGVVDFSDIPFDTTEFFGDKFLFAKVRDYTSRNRIKDIVLQNEFSLAFFDYYQPRSSERREIPYFLFIGGMALIIAFFVGYYFLYRDKLFIVYSLYLLALLLYLGSKAGFAQDFLREYFTASIYFYNNIIQVVVNIFYLLFSIYFLSAKKEYPKLYVFLKYTIYFLLFITVLLSVLYIVDPLAGVEETILNIERYYMILFSLLAYVHILVNYKSRLAIFFVVGSFTFLSGAALALFLRNVEYMMYGAALEVFIFSLGMGYRMKQVEEARKSIEGEINRVRLTALKAQMNPHFIFNSLNSIRAYVISARVKEASSYLSKFAQLIRLILYYSSKEEIELHEEIEALKLYVELEELRFRDDYGFKIIVEGNLEMTDVLVPPLILQPYVENAIRHGLAPKQGEKSLEIKISRKDDHIVFSVRDNGVGRQYSQNLKARQKSDHKSMAMELTKSRIDLMGLNSSGLDQVLVLDHYNSGKPDGTEVVLTIPLKIKH